MKLNMLKHGGYSVCLLIVLLLGIFLALQTSYDKTLQIVIILLTAFFYVVAGMVHHILNHDISSKIVIEYILIGALGVSVIYFFLRA